MISVLFMHFFTAPFRFYKVKELGRCLNFKWCHLDKTFPDLLTSDRDFKAVLFFNKVIFVIPFYDIRICINL